MMITAKANITMACQPTTESPSGNRSHTIRRSPYLERVEEALSRSFLKMEPYLDSDAYFQKSNTDYGYNKINSCCSEGREVKHGPRRPFYPHVELGTAPIEVEHIEDLQKIRPFGVSTNHHQDIHPSKPCGRIGSKSSRVAKESFATIATDPSKTRTMATLSMSTSASTRTRESCMIESTRNSVRVSFLFKAQANAALNARANAKAKANADPLEASILFQWMRFLMTQEHHPLLRKKPIAGYSVTFLVTNKHLSLHGRETVEDSILCFCAKIDKECSDIKLQVNAEARYVTAEFLKAFNSHQIT